jgi:hypothetical protein
LSPTIYPRRCHLTAPKIKGGWAVSGWARQLWAAEQLDSLKTPFWCSSSGLLLVFSPNQQSVRLLTCCNGPMLSMVGFCLPVRREGGIYVSRSIKVAVRTPAPSKRIDSAAACFSFLLSSLWWCAPTHQQWS